MLMSVSVSLATMVGIARIQMETTAALAPISGQGQTVMWMLTNASMILVKMEGRATMKMVLSTVCAHSKLQDHSVKLTAETHVITDHVGMEAVPG